MTKVYEARFAANLELLRGYLTEHGTSDVPIAYVTEGVALGRWVGYQRSTYRRGRLPQARVEALEALEGWHWERRTPGARPNVERNERIRSLRSQGVSLEAIACEFGLSKQRVHQLLNAA